MRLVNAILNVRTIIEGFDLVASKYPDNIAIVYLGEKFTYHKLHNLVNKFAAGIYEYGVRKNDKVILYIGNSQQWVIAYLACQRIGAIPVPISPIYTPFEVQYIANNCGAETIIASDLNFGYALEVLKNSNIKRIIYGNMADMLPFWKRLFGKLFDKIPEGDVEKSDNVVHFNDVLRSGIDFSSINSIEIDEHHPCHILYTSGTTGLPKGIIHTHKFVINAYKDILKMYMKLGEANQIFVFAGPLFHMFWQDMFFGIIIFRGNTCILLPRATNKDAILDSIERYRATLFAGVPTLYIRLMESDRFDMYDLSSLKYCWSAGDVLPVEVYKRWLKKVGCPILQVYGTTEIVVFSLSPLNDKDYAPPKIGIKVPSRDYLLIDPGNLNPISSGEFGELLVSAEAIPNEYIDRPDETADTFIELNGKIWYRTKDIIKVDDKGYFYFVDRSRDIIKYKGYKISASEIESMLLNHPAVVETCVIGVPDKEVGERIKAFIVLKEDVRGVSAEELKKWLRKRLVSYKIPDYIEFRDYLPKSKIGKLLKRELRDEEIRKIKG